MPVLTKSLQQRLEQLVEVAPELISTLALESVLQRVADVAREVLDARYAAIGLLGPDGEQLESFTTSGISPEDRALIGPLPRGHGILGLVIREGRIIRIPDLTRHPDSFGFPPHHPPMHSFLGVPIIGRRGVIGDLYLTEKRGAPEFSDDDEYVARLLAATTAAAVDNARLHEESARLIEEVQHLHRSRERFFAMVNHELRNSLAAVYGWAEMLTRKKDPTTVPRAAFEVLDSAEGAISLINDLLDLSRLDEDRLKPVIKDVECAGVVRQAVARVTPAAQARQVRLEVDLAPNLPACRTDPHRVEQILVNLLGNAIRHTPEESRVQVKAEMREGAVLFTIDDEGPGIPPEEVERIFDIYQTKAGEEGKGAGLGLPLSRRLARLLGGGLKAVSRPGDGGRFELSLPAAGSADGVIMKGDS